ncbi:hypothetical protein DFS34DRAFT_335917 [Phlyctochytrium arcticum]|nr:hypothetical protein DFS34DRAFT_335917 [Phlyctochytrium arcticum]
MLFIFVLDSSTSMNRKFSENMTYLDSAKAAISHFFKREQAFAQRKDNKYMLVSYEEPYYKTLLDTDDEKVLLRELKLIRASDISVAGASFGAAFEYLDCYGRKRDPIGLGRYPANAETTLMFWFTDGSSFMEKTGETWSLTNQLNIPRLRSPGSEFYPEPFRWDQRLFTFWLTPEIDPNSRVMEMSRVMGGQWWQIPNPTYLLQCIDNCVQTPVHANVFPLAPICHIEGVLLHLMEHPDTSKWHSTSEQSEPPSETLLLYCTRTSTRNFPIPEPFWVPAESGGKSPPNLLRTSHPHIYYTRSPDIYPIPENFPIDRFNIDQNCKIVRELMQQPGQPSWTLYVKGSDGTNGFGKPFGTLKYSGSTQTVSLYIMPYAFPPLFAMILPLRRRQAPQPVTSQIISDFHSYVYSVPAYYREPLRRAMAAIGLQQLWPKELPVDIHPEILQKNQDASVKAANELTRVYQDLRGRRAVRQLKPSTKPRTPPTFHWPKHPSEIPRDQLIFNVDQMRQELIAAIDGPGPVIQRFLQAERELATHAADLLTGPALTSDFSGEEEQQSDEDDGSDRTEPMVIPQEAQAASMAATEQVETRIEPVDAMEVDLQPSTTSQPLPTSAKPDAYVATPPITSSYTTYAPPPSPTALTPTTPSPILHSPPLALPASRHSTPPPRSNSPIAPAISPLREPQTLWTPVASFASIRADLHSLLWQFPRYYNEAALLDILDGVPRMQSLTLLERAKLLEHVVDAARAFKRERVSAYATQILTRMGPVTIPASPWFDDDDDLGSVGVGA